MTIKKKLILVSLIFIFITFAVGLIGLVNIKNISVNADELSKQWLPAVQQTDVLANDVTLFRVAELQYAFSEDALNREKYMMEMTAIRQRISKELDEYDKDHTRSEHQNLASDLIRNWTMYLENHMKVMKLGEEGKPSEALLIIRNDQQSIYENMIGILNQMTEANNEMVSQITSRNYSIQNKTYRQIFVVIFLSLIFCLVVSSWLLKSLLTPIKGLTEAAEVLAKGDLTSSPKIERNDELGILANTFAKMVEYIQKLIAQIKTMNMKLSSYSDQLAKDAVMQKSVVIHIDKNVTKVTSMAEKQTENMAEGNKSLQEEIGRIKALAQWSETLSNNSQEVIFQTEQGTANLQKVLSQTTYLIQSMTQTINTMNVLKEESAKINEITKIITEIARRVKLVSLNASIQAASAGHQGISFKVVAEEIGSLAVQSSDAVSEISKMIISIQEEINRSVTTFEQSQNQVDIVNSLINELNRSFNTIALQIRDTNQTISLISESAQRSSVSTFELGNKINDVFHSSSEMVASCQQIAASTEEQVKSINELVTISEKLNDVVKESINLISTVRT